MTIMAIRQHGGRGGDGVEISVIIPLCNALDDLPELLQALSNQTLVAGSIEIILVDDASTDGSLEWLVENCPPGIRVLSNQARRGSYAARNLGLTSATGENLAFTDADCRPDPGWLDAGHKALRGFPRIAGRVDLVCSEHPSVAELVDTSRFLRQRRFVHEGFGATANLFVRREVFDHVGLFEERLVSGGDYEFGQRASAAGFSITYEDHLVVRHPCRRTLRELIKKAYRVGYGFGQSLRMSNSPARSSVNRVVDRLLLSTGRGLEDRGKVVRKPALRLAIIAELLIINFITFLAMPIGYISALLHDLRPIRWLRSSLEQVGKIVSLRSPPSKLAQNGLIGGGPGVCLQPSNRDPLSAEME
jgi:glycosyltransferase involved in cell wall biosynthesis